MIYTKNKQNCILKFQKYVLSVEKFWLGNVTKRSKGESAALGYFSVSIFFWASRQLRIKKQI